MVLIPGCPPDDCLPTTSNRPTGPSDIRNLHPEPIRKTLEKYWKLYAHEIEKLKVEFAKISKELWDDWIKQSHHGKCAMSHSPRNNQYKIVHNELDENDENIVRKILVPTQRTMVDEDKKLENEQKKKSNQ